MLPHHHDTRAYQLSSDCSMSESTRLRMSSSLRRNTYLRHHPSQNDKLATQPAGARAHGRDCTRMGTRRQAAMRAREHGHDTIGGAVAV